MEEGEKSVARMAPDEIIEAIFKAVPTERFTNVSEISSKVGCSWASAKKYLDLVWRIQKGPRMIPNFVSRRQIIWKKEYGNLPDEVVV